MLYLIKAISEAKVLTLNVNTMMPLETTCITKCLEYKRRNRNQSHWTTLKTRYSYDVQCIRKNQKFWESEVAIVKACKRQARVKKQAKTIYFNWTNFKMNITLMVLYECLLLMNVFMVLTVRVGQCRDLFFHYFD